MLEAIGITFAISVILSFVNHRWLKLPTSAGIMLGGLVITTLFALLEPSAPDFFGKFFQLIEENEFEQEFFETVLGMLLFAGALHIDLKDLGKEKAYIALISSLGLIISATITGLLLFACAQALGLQLDLFACLLFGVLISPTEPITAIEALVKQNAPESLRLQVEGESKFSEGMTIILISILLLVKREIDMGQGNFVILEEVSELLLEELLLGVGIGFGVGMLILVMVRNSIYEPQLAAIINLGLAIGGIALCSLLDAFIPIALLTAGLIVGPRIHASSIPRETRNHIHYNWMMLDEVLTGFIYLLVGLSLHLIDYQSEFILLGLLAIPLTLAARFVGTTTSLALSSSDHSHIWGRSMLLTWSGIRGPASIALAMSLTDIKGEHAMLFMTCAVVIFSTLIQSLSFGPLAKRFAHRE